MCVQARITSKDLKNGALTLFVIENHCWRNNDSITFSEAALMSLSRDHSEHSDFKKSTAFLTLYARLTTVSGFYLITLVNAGPQALM